MAEEWRPWREGTYEVSSEGRVRRGKPGRSTRVGKILRPGTKPRGYLFFVAHVDRVSTTVYVHAAVAESFIGPRPNDRPQINHIDGCKTNNASANLEYVTASGNATHAHRTGLTRIGDRHPFRLRPEIVRRGERVPSSKMKPEDVAAIRARVASGTKQTTIVAEFGISPAQVSRIVNRSHWRHL